MKTVSELRSLPKILFLIDSTGALVTAVLTGVVLPLLEPIGLPNSVLYALAAVAVMFSVYSFFRFYFFAPGWARFLATIAFANTTYSLGTLALVFYFRESVTLLGMLYFFGETAIVITLAMVEWRVSRTRNA